MADFLDHGRLDEPDGPLQRLYIQTQEVRSLILYATVFNTCIVTIAAVRLFLWQVLLRQGTIRELKRLELRILELTKTLETQGPAA